MNVEVANDVDPKYEAKHCTIISVQIGVGDIWVCIVYAWHVPVWLRGQIRAGEWCYDDVGSCEVQFSTSSELHKNLYVLTYMWLDKSQLQDFVVVL